MKKIITLLLVLTLAITAFAGCAPKAPASKLPDVGTTEEIVKKINENGKVEMMVDVSKLVINPEGYSIASFTGLTDDEFTKYVEEGYVSQSMIGSQAHSIVFLKLKNANDGKVVADIMNEKIDRRKWICVAAEKSYVNTSGNYVFFVMSNSETCDATSKAFEELAGTFGTAIVEGGKAE